MSKDHKNRIRRKDAAIVELHKPHAEGVQPMSEAQRPLGAWVLESQPSSKVTPIRTRSTPEYVERIIRRRAYELYRQRGRQDGHAKEDWLRAESEILGTILRKGKVG
jgi:Protein of unknown function (DUF2934)